MEKILIVGSGGSGSIPLAVQEMMKEKNIEVEYITQEMADKLLGHRTPEVKQLLSVIPKTYIHNPPATNRRERRKQNRLKSKKR